MISPRLAAGLSRGVALALLFTSNGPALGASAVDPAAEANGVVFDDRNGNGSQDIGEPGIPDVAVSNGSTIVVTGGAGQYRIPAGPDSRVFAIKPRGWAVPLTNQNLPQYYRKLAGVAGDPGACSFPLAQREEPDIFQALLFTDTQPNSAKDVEYLDRTVVNGLAGQGKFAFGITLGDIANDRADLYTPLNKVMANIGAPLYRINGNHDLDLDTRDDRGATASFEAAYGPSTYAFHQGGALFIGVNNVRFLGGPRYVGGLRDDQFAFIENLLRIVPREQLVVLMMHIPWFFPSPANVQTFRAADRARLFALFENRPNNLWISGHTHYQRHVFYGPADGWKGAQPLHEYNVAAASGGFWGGPPDANGIPVATMWDGTPHGYGILSVDGAKAKVDYRAARHPPTYQIGVHAPRAAKPKTSYISFYANVFNGHDGWRVEARLDDREWKTVSRVLEWDPAYAKLYLDQDFLGRPLATPRLPDPTVCYHLWRGYLPADLALGPHRLEVRATDPYGQTFTASREVSIVEPAL